MTDSRKHIVGPTERREEIARTFHPERFRVPASTASPVLLKAYRDLQEDALAKADAILASDGREVLEEEMKAAIFYLKEARELLHKGREMVRELVEALGDLSTAFDTVMREEHIRGAQGENLFLALPMSVTGTWGELKTRARAIHAKAKEWLGK